MNNKDEEYHIEYVGKILFQNMEYLIKKCELQCDEWYKRQLEIDCLMEYHSEYYEDFITFRHNKNDDDLPF